LVFLRRQLDRKTTGEKKNIFNPKLPRNAFPISPRKNGKDGAWLRLGFGGTISQHRRRSHSHRQRPRTRAKAPNPKNAQAKRHEPSIWLSASVRIPSMSFPFDPRRSRLFFSPEYGGDVVSGGGHPADSPVPAEEAIDEALGRDTHVHGRIGGIGVPGTKTNPVGQSRDEVARRAYELWEEAGRPDGRSEEFWLRAEEEFRHRRE
jgi:hypothetical protein